VRRFVPRVALIGMLLAASAGAAPSAQELSRARAKFQQATELEQAGNYTSAIELFREVGQVRMTPQVRYHIALCEEKLGRLLAALGGYELAQADAQKVDKSFEKEVKARAEDLRTRIPKLVIERGAGATAARIELDGVALGASSIGTELKLDPGPHEVTARASGYEPFSTTVELAERDTKTVEVVLTSSAPDEPVVAPEVEPRDPGVEEERPSKVFPLLLGGLGIASLGASGAFFLMKRSAIDDLDGQCDADRNCPPSSQDTYDKAKLYDTISMATLGAGVLCVGISVTLLLTQGGSSKAPEKTGFRLVPSAPNAHAGVSVFRAF
jgi:tetratricopeptide (TPR) repeat protein